MNARDRMIELFEESFSPGRARRIADEILDAHAHELAEEIRCMVADDRAYRPKWKAGALVAADLIDSEAS